VGEDQRIGGSKAPIGADRRASGKIAPMEEQVEFETLPD
jgi:hypothetical protein